MNGLVPISRKDEDALINLVRQHNLPISKLRCEFTRQRARGSGITPRGRPYDIEYDLMMCHYCGNLPGSPNNGLYCPHKMRQLRDKWLGE